MEVSIFFLNLFVNRSKKCDASFVYFLTTWLLTYQKVWFKIQYFWQNYCEHIKRCDVFFVFCCFLLFVFFTTLLWTQQNVGVKCLFPRHSCKFIKKCNASVRILFTKLSVVVEREGERERVEKWRIVGISDFPIIFVTDFLQDFTF